MGKLARTFYLYQYKFLIFIVLFTFFCDLFIDSLMKGGRWDLYQAIAVADRFLNGNGFYYSVTEASTPYFPLVSYIAVLVGTFCFEYRDYIMLTIASIIGIIYFYLIFSYTLSRVRYKLFAIAIFSVVILAGLFSYKEYLNEFKPDTLLLLWSFLVIYVIERIEKSDKLRIGEFLLLFILLNLMNLTKQHAAIINVSLFLYVLLKKFFYDKNKYACIFVFCLANLISLYLILSIPGILINTVYDLKMMPYHDVTNIIHELFQTFRHNFVFVLLFGYCIYNIKKLPLNAFLHKLLIVSISFFIFQILGGMKVGGNIGNYEVALVPFLPFVLLAGDRFIKKIDKKIDINKICYIIIMVICLVDIGRHFYKINDVVSKIKEDNQIVNYLNSKCNNTKIMYYSNEYMNVYKSGAIPGMDIYTVPVNLENYKDVIYNAIHCKKYKYVYIDPGFLKYRDRTMSKCFSYKVSSYDELITNYKLVEDEKMPNKIKGKLYVVKDN